MARSTLWVSIVIPAYNAEAVLARALQSAVRQTHRPCQIIVVDDGSQDRTAAVAESFGAGVQVLQGPRQGASAARNRGLAVARGQFIQFLDADDVLAPDKIQNHLAAEATHHGAITFCDGQARGLLGEPSVYRRTDDTTDPVVFALSGPLPTPAPLHRRDLLQEVGGFREGLPCAQERDLHLRLACLGAQFVRVPKKGFTVYKQAQSLSGNWVKVMGQYPSILWPVYGALKNSGKMNEARAEAFAALMAFSARQLVRLGHRALARSFFDQARNMHPGGGVAQVYRPWTRLIRQVLGPVMTETLVAWKRRSRLA